MNVSPNIEVVTKRVAAAFGVKEFDVVGGAGDSSWEFRGETEKGAHFVIWELDVPSCQFRRFIVGDVKPCAVVRYNVGEQGSVSVWACSHTSDPEHAAVMARALYCLGIENRHAWKHLTYPSSHEQMELRLSMPQEYWPPSWKEGANN